MLDCIIHDPIEHTVSGMAASVFPCHTSHTHMPAGRAYNARPDTFTPQRGVNLQAGTRLQASALTAGLKAATMQAHGDFMVNDLSRSEKLLAEKTVCVLLVRGEDPDGQPIFAYVAVRADKLEAFMAAQKSGIFYPEEYGIIVESGSGEPTEEVKARMETEYGFNHQSMLTIPDSDSAQEVASELTKNLSNKNDSFDA